MASSNRIKRSSSEFHAVKIRLCDHFVYIILHLTFHKRTDYNLVLIKPQA